MNKMIVSVNCAQCDGFDVKVIGEDDRILFTDCYSFGRNVSWSRDWASAEKPYAGEVLRRLMGGYNIGSLAVKRGEGLLLDSAVDLKLVEDFIFDYLK